MSFILDALKKSESDRQRQNGPALFEVKVAPPRSRLPLWALAIGLLLAVNLGVVAWMLLRHPAAREPARVLPAASAPALTPAPAAAIAPATSLPGPATAAASAPAPTPASAAAQVPPVMLPATSAPASGTEPTSAEDLAPAAEPAAPLSTHVHRGTVEGVPLYQDWAASSPGKAPELRLDLHVYAPRVEERFVMINMKKMREGETLPNGVRLESITPEGAVMSYNGSRFLLTRD
jgi:general secretion pathway protein B